MSYDVEETIETHYCTPDDVARVIRFPDNSENRLGVGRFDETTVPSYEDVCEIILSNEEQIDRYTNRSWRVNRVKDELVSIGKYQFDAITTGRPDFWARGGNYITLNRDILPWDPQQGDKLEIRYLNNGWVDISQHYDPNPQFTREKFSGGNFWIDYEGGTLFLYNHIMQSSINGARISYRYGKEGKVPSDIKRACCLMTADALIQQDPFLIAVGSGGDIAGVKKSLNESYWNEINRILAANRRAGAVISMLG